MNKSFTHLLLLALLAQAFVACSRDTKPPLEPLLVELELQVPTAGWTLEIQNAWLSSQDEIICLWQLTPPPGMAADMISNTHSSATLNSKSLPVKHFILGKTWNWESDSHVSYIDSIDQIQKELANAQVIVIAN